MPFITAGDPDLLTTVDLIREFDALGCHMCEIGIPYSDPIADGPVIQASYTRALQRGISVKAILGALNNVAPQISMPTVSMVSYAIVHRIGPREYVQQAIASGLSGIIVPDLPVEEAGELSRICQDDDFSLIQLVTPTTSRDRAKRILETSTGFIYYVSVTGITGERTELPDDVIENVTWLRETGDLPVCIGFGISEPRHVKLLAPHADGLIVGSAIVRRIADCTENGRPTIPAISEYIRDMLAAMNQN